MGRRRKQALLLGRLTERPALRTSMQRLRRLAMLGALLVSTTLTLSSCSWLPFGGASSKGRLVHGLYIKTAIVALIVVGGVIATLVIELVAFRRRRGDNAEAPQDHGKPLIYGGFFVIGLVLIAILFPFSESTLSKVDAVAEHPDLHLTITGSQWQWAAAYQKQGITVSGRSYKTPMRWELPINESAKIDLKSTDVIHGFYMPQFNFSKNAIPGVTNTFSFTPDRLGTYRGQCTQLCGVGHYQMSFVLKVVTVKQFSQWVHQQQTAARGAKCGAESNTVALTAKDIAWSEKCIHVHANRPVTLTMKNEDSAVTHNFSVYSGPDKKKHFFKGPLLKGPATATLHIPALPAGTYYFQCDVHGVAMSGTYMVTN
jgi:cytochrome c oxidase subunit II